MQVRVLRDGHSELAVSQLCLGTMYFGTTVSRAMSFELLDRFASAGGALIDTANCYASWVDGANGTESELLIGRWLRSRDAYQRVRIATKIGAARARREEPYDASNREGLSPATIRLQAEASRERLGVERIDVLYAHVDDRSVPLDEVVSAFDDLVRDRVVGMVAASNYATWRLALARDLAVRRGLRPFCAIQQRRSFLSPAPEVGTGPNATQLPATPELLDYVESQPGMTLLAYSPLLRGAYSRPDRPLPRKPINYDHAGAPGRLAVLFEVAAELAVPVSQLVLAWLMGGAVPAIPVLGVSSVGQLDECLGAAGLTLDPPTRGRLENVEQ